MNSFQTSSIAGQTRLLRRPRHAVSAAAAAVARDALRRLCSDANSGRRGGSGPCHCLTCGARGAVFPSAGHKHELGRAVTDRNQPSCRADGAASGHQHSAKTAPSRLTATAAAGPPGSPNQGRARPFRRHSGDSTVTWSPAGN